MSKNNTATPASGVGNMSKSEFITRYVLNRARTVPSTLHAATAVKEAGDAWDLLQIVCPTPKRESTNLAGDTDAQSRG